MSIETDLEKIDARPFGILASEVGKWSHLNFGDDQEPYLGMVEELGELSRCLLKRKQKIRGFDDPAFFFQEFVDAIGDIGIYAANFAYNNKLYVSWPKVGIYPPENAVKYIANACCWLSKLLNAVEASNDQEKWLYNFLLEIATIAKLEHMELDSVVNVVWSRVVLRDWKQNSHNGVAIDGTN